MTQTLNEHRSPTQFYPTLCEKTTEGRIRLGGEAQLADVKNANGRVYRQALWNRVFEDQRFRDRLESRKVLGELDHPGDGRSKLERAALVVTDMRLAASKRYPGKTAVYMEYETLTTPMGRILEALINDKIGVAVSSRGDGEVRRIKDAEFGEAQEVIPETFRFETFDVVIDPSVDVDIRRIGESTVMAGAVHKILESEGNNLKTSDITFYQELLEDLQAVANVENLKATASAIMTTPTTPHLAPRRTDIMSVENTNAPAALEAAQTTISDLTGKLKAAESLSTQLVVDAKNYKMRAEHFEELYNNAKRELEESNNIVASMLEADEESDVEETPQYTELAAAHESLKKEYEAAEELVESMSTMLQQATLESHIEKVTEDLSPNQLASVKPFLVECETTEQVDAQLKSLRGLISAGSGSAVTATITPRNPIEQVTESTKRKNESKAPGTTTAIQMDSRLTESLTLNEAMKATRR